MKNENGKKWVRVFAIAMTLAIAIMGTVAMAAHTGGGNLPVPTPGPGDKIEVNTDVKSTDVMGFFEPIENSLGKDNVITSTGESEKSEGDVLFNKSNGIVNSLATPNAETSASKATSGTDVIGFEPIENSLGKDNVITSTGESEKSEGDEGDILFNKNKYNGIINSLATPNAEASASKATTDLSALADAEPYTAGSLSPGTYILFYRQTIGQGARITIGGTWTPVTSNLDVGLYSHASGLVYYVTLSGGSGSVAFDLLATDDYSIFVGNPSATTVRFDISYVIN